MEKIELGTEMFFRLADDFTIIKTAAADAIKIMKAYEEEIVK